MTPVMPNVKGMAPPDAQLVLEKLGCKVHLVGYRPQAGAQVVRVQRPESGALLRPGHVVTLLITT